MYSPHISDELVRRLYKIAKNKKVHMTTLVNELLQSALDNSDGVDVQPISHYTSAQPMLVREKVEGDIHI